MGGAEDVADAVAFLASDDGRWVTGHVLDVSGGLHIGSRAGVEARPAVVARSGGEGP